MNKPSNKDSYNRIAVQWTTERNRSFVSKLIIDFGNKVKPGGKILDLGCGSGIPNAAYLSSRGFHLTGIDTSEKMIEIAKVNNIPNASFELWDILEYKPSNHFDGILAWDSLFHLPYESQEGIYQTIYNWLNEGGWFLFSHGGGYSELIDEMYGEQFYYSCLSAEKVRQLLTAADFKIEWMIEDYKERDMDKALVVLAKK